MCVCVFEEKRERDDGDQGRVNRGRENERKRTEAFNLIHYYVISLNAEGHESHFICFKS